MNTKLKLDSDYPYAYETHLHTKTGSACAHNTGAEMASACKEAGYTGIIVTDHFVYGNTAVDRSLPWTEWVTEYVKGYEQAKEEGDRIGLQVFFGWESSYNGTEFLIWGLTPDWLMKHPEIRDCNMEEQFVLVHQSGGIVVHAHPFRTADYIPQIRLVPELVDAVEAVNATHSCKLFGGNNDLFNEQATAYAKEYGLPMTAGSDVHSTQMLYGGMAFARPMKDAKDLCECVLNREPCVLLDGNNWI